MNNPLVIDATGHVEPFNFVLARRNLTHIGMLHNVDQSSVTYKNNLNGANELSLTIYKDLDGVQEELWDEITDFRLIYIPSLNEYFQIAVSVDDSIDSGTQKTLTGTSLCEAELGQTNLYNVEINTEDDIARKDYVVTKFYNENNPKGSLLNRILEKMPHYTIGHVDDSLRNLQRSFSINGTSIYDFLTGDCADQFNCLITFDSATRTINAYDLYTVCLDCGHRGEFNDKCPECGSTNLKVYGKDTTIYVDKENLTDQVSLDADDDSVKNTFHLVAGDDEMTAAVQNINPNGSAYLYYFSQDAMHDMSDELKAKIKSYNTDYNKALPDYRNITSKIYDAMDEVLNLQSKMMPKMSDEVSDSKTEASKIANNLRTVAISNLSKSSTIATINSAIKNLCKVYIKSGYFKVTIPSDAANNTTASFSYSGVDSDGNDYGYWTGQITVTNYSDEDDTTTTGTLSVKVTDMYEEYLKEKINKEMQNIGKDSDKENADYLGVVNVVSNDLPTLKTKLKSYCLSLLTSYHDAVQGALEVMQAEGHGEPESMFYSSIYLPYYNKMLAIQDEIDTRQKQIDAKNAELDGYMKQRDAIQKKLNFRSYLGETLFKEFCSYRREQEYSNENFISDGLDNAEIIKKAEEFLKDAKQELTKAGETQYSLSSNLYNLLLIPEFEPLIEYFDVGNWIRVGVDDEVYRLRLVSYQISFSDLTKIDVEFSNVTKTASGVNDVKSILDSAQSMSTTYSYVAKQADKGNKAEDSLSYMRQNSLNASLYRIQNNDQQEISYDRHGLLSRSYDDIGDGYSDEQLKITHNIIAFTDDNWKSVKQAIGKQEYDLNGIHHEGYGVNADFVLSGTIVGGDLYSDNYSENGKTGSYFNLRDGSFSLGGQRIKYDQKSGTVTMTNISLVPGTTKVGDSTVASLQDVSSSEKQAKSYADSVGFSVSKSANEYSDNRIKYLDDSFNQQKVFNRLTNNGAEQGLYLNEGKLYLNGSYVKTGTLDANLIKAGVIQDKLGNNYWNLQTGEFQLKSMGSISDYGTEKKSLQDYADGKASSALSDAKSYADDKDKALNQTQVFNRLTSNGQFKGIYMEDGNLYMNADYIKSGKLIGREIENGNGTFKVTSDGNMTSKSGYIGTWRIGGNGLYDDTNQMGIWTSSGISCLYGGLTYSQFSDAVKKLGQTGDDSLSSLPLIIRSTGNARFSTVESDLISRKGTNNTSIVGGMVSTSNGNQKMSRAPFIYAEWNDNITIGSGSYYVQTLTGVSKDQAGYDFLCFTVVNGGYTDQWMHSVSWYNGNIVDLIYSKYGASLSNHITIRAWWISKNFCEAL